LNRIVDKNILCWINNIQKLQTCVLFPEILNRIEQGVEKEYFGAELLTYKVTILCPVFSISIHFFQFIYFVKNSTVGTWTLQKSDLILGIWYSVKINLGTSLAVTLLAVTRGVHSMGEWSRNFHHSHFRGADIFSTWKIGSGY